MIRFEVTRSSVPEPPIRILFADDNELVRAAVLGLLQSLGHRVDVVTNGREAVDLAAQQEFDLVLLDIQMPEMDGLAAAAALRRAYVGDRPPRILGYSGEAQNRESCSAAGMDGMLIKPARLVDLIRALETPDSAATKNG